MNPDGIVHLLWTGGWDSTFRLLDLILVRNKQVQPYYVIDPGRLSTEIELRTMRKIKQKLFEEDPFTRRLLLPTKYRESYDIAQNNEITESWKKLREKYHIGSQYDWFSRWADEEDIKLEISIHAYRDGRVFSALENFVVSKNNYFEIDRKWNGSDIFVVFKNVIFPILDVSKTEMVNISKQAGFYNLMELTWFCHQPRRNESPCGLCSPCICAIEEGLAWRLPWTSRGRYFCRKSFRSGVDLYVQTYFRLQNKLSKFPRIYSTLRAIKDRMSRLSVARKGHLGPMDGQR